MGNYGSSERRKSLHILTLEKRQQPIITRPSPLHTSSMPPLPGNVVAPTIECALGRPDDVGRSCFGFDTWPCGHSFYPVRPTTAKNRLFCRKMLKIPHLQR